MKKSSILVFKLEVAGGQYAIIIVLVRRPLTTNQQQQQKTDKNKTKVIYKIDWLNFVLLLLIELILSGVIVMSTVFGNGDSSVSG